jgi:hypothetical protein
MIQITPQLSNSGVSVFSEKRKSTKMLTPEGKEYWARKVLLVKKASETHETKQFYFDHLQREAVELDKEMREFLNYGAKQYPMTEKDSVGWLLYNTLLDKITALTHFIKVMKK